MTGHVLYEEGMPIRTTSLVNMHVKDVMMNMCICFDCGFIISVGEVLTQIFILALMCQLHEVST